MSFSDPRSQFVSSSQSYVVPCSDAINIWPQFSSETEDQAPDFDQNPAPFKRARNSEERQSNSPVYGAGIPIPANAPTNKGVNNIFFKTRLCAKFKMGMCRNGENCNFAHGIDDMRHPPPNWQEMVGLRGEEDHRPLGGNWDDDQKIIHRMKICKKFYNGEECPYGDRCNFLHEDPSKYRDDSGRFRESSAISIGVTANAGTVVSVGGPSIGDDSRGIVYVNVNGSDPLRGVSKPVYWKTKLCNKWEQTGHCPFGEKCHFAHGFPGTQSARHKLQAGYGRAESEIPSIASVSTKPQVSANDSHSTAPTNVAFSNEEAQRNKKCMLKWKGLKKINRIYADWLDDLPLAHNIPSRVES